MLTPAEWSAVRLSVVVAVSASTLVLPFGVALGYLLARRDFAGRWLVEMIVSLPLVVPPVVTGFVLLEILGRRGPVGMFLEEAFGIRIAFTWWGAVVASGVVGFPLLVRSARIAFEGVDARLETTARTLGASWRRAFCTVSLPLAWRGVAGGWILCFARSLGEFGATIVIAANIPGKTQTIPLAIYSLIQDPGSGDRAWMLVGVSIALACLAMLASELLVRTTSRATSHANAAV